MKEVINSLNNPIIYNLQLWLHTHTYVYIIYTYIIVEILLLSTMSSDKMFYYLIPQNVTLFGDRVFMRDGY